MPCKSSAGSFTNFDFSSSAYRCSSLPIGSCMLHLVPIMSILQSCFIRDIKSLLNFVHKISIRSRFMASSDPDTMSSAYAKTSHLVAPVRPLSIERQVNVLKRLIFAKSIVSSFELVATSGESGNISRKLYSGSLIICKAPS